MSFLLAYHRRRTWGPPANCRIQTKQKLVLFWLTLRDRILCAVVVRGFASYAQLLMMRCVEKLLRTRNSYIDGKFRMTGHG